jgi:N-dimethylarginine dimethylaminohydrolase
MQRAGNRRAHGTDVELDWGRHYLMCPPSHFGVFYSINPWMDRSAPVDTAHAAAQWQRLVHVMEDAGAKVEQIDPVSGLPDMVFTANAGLVDGDRFFPARMRHAERRGEPAHFSNWFAGHGYQIASEGGSESLEGAGDALPFRGALIAGHGQRSTLAAWTALASMTGITVRGVRLSDPRFYHVDLAFCPLDERTAMFAPTALGEAGRNFIARLVPDPVPLSAEEAALFCANSVVVGRTVIMPACTPRLGRCLRRRGFEVEVVDVSEFQKAGGGCRCLTLALDTVLTAPLAAARHPAPGMVA